jgi:hypothetical protein
MTDSDKKMTVIVYAAVGCTMIAGILHVFMAPGSLSREFLEGLFFLISGGIQVFWALPVIKEWNKIFYFVGIGGTVVLFGLWFIPRILGLASGRGLRISEIAILIEGFQIAFIVLCIIIVKKKSVKKQIPAK